MKGERLEELISDPSVSSFHLSLPSHSILQRFLSCFGVAAHKEVPVFHSFCPRSLLKDLLWAHLRWSQIPTNHGVAEVGCARLYISTDLYLVAWFKTSETYLSMLPVGVAIPSPLNTLCLSFSIIEGIMTSFLTIKVYFDPLRQKQWVKSSFSASWEQKLGKEMSYSHQQGHPWLNSPWPTALSPAIPHEGDVTNTTSQCTVLAPCVRAPHTKEQVGLVCKNLSLKSEWNNRESRILQLFMTTLTFLYLFIHRGRVSKSCSLILFAYFIESVCNFWRRISSRVVLHCAVTQYPDKEERVDRESSQLAGQDYFIALDIFCCCYWTHK